MYVVRIQRAVTQTVKAGLVLYLHSKKKKIINVGKIHLVYFH